MVTKPKRRAGPPPAMMKAGEFKAKCLGVMDRVAATGQSIIITKRGQPMVRLEPVLRRPTSVLGIAGGVVQSTGDIISPVDVDWEALKP